MFKLVALCALFVVAAAASFDSSLDEHWVTFAKTYGKVYKPDEEMFRRAIWEKNVRMIRKHNLEADMGLHTFTLGMNEHGDLSDEEFKQTMKGYAPTHNSSSSSTFLPPSNYVAPAMVDWRTKGYVTAVKDQKQCGSCWAFSATGSLEGQHFKKTKMLVSLSEQDLVDCSRKEGNLGCGGGSMDAAFKYIKMHGVATEAEYPYKARNEKCKRTHHHMKIGATCTGFTDIEEGSEADLKSAVATVGPVSVAIDASAPTFRFYRRGVYYSTKCSSEQLDHGVLAVGFGTTGEKDYWIVKNSWGKSWGNKGYIWMSRNKRNNCGIATDASYPLV